MIGNYHALETLTKLHAEEMEREAATAALAARLRTPQPSLRERAARTLRAYARRIHPAGVPRSLPRAEVVAADAIVVELRPDGSAV